MKKIKFLVGADLESALAATTVKHINAILSDDGNNVKYLKADGSHGYMTKARFLSCTKVVDGGRVWDIPNQTW